MARWCSSIHHESKEHKIEHDPISSILLHLLFLLSVSDQFALTSKSVNTAFTKAVLHCVTLSISFTDIRQALKNHLNPQHTGVPAHTCNYIYGKWTRKKILLLKRALQCSTHWVLLLCTFGKNFSKWSIPLAPRSVFCLNWRWFQAGILHSFFTSSRFKT